MSVASLYNQFDVRSSIAGDANVQVFKGVNGIDGRSIHCEDYIKLTSEHYHVCMYIIMWDLVYDRFVCDLVLSP